MPQGPINLGKVMAAHARFSKEMRALIDTETRRAGEFALHHVQLHQTFKRRTGRLQDSTKAKVVRLRSGAVLKLTNAVPYAAAIEYGSRPHKITAKAGKTLAFMGRGGAMVFRQSVNHPGNRPYKFLYRATNAAGRVFEAAMKSGMAKLAKIFEDVE